MKNLNHKIIKTGLTFCLFFIFTTRIYAYTDEQIVNAIYLAEGGKNAKYKYGIRSVSYSGELEAREICFRTVSNTRRRYENYEFKESVSFIRFLQRRYCPDTGENLTVRERELNGNWYKNVMFFLQRGEK